MTNETTAECAGGLNQKIAEQLRVANRDQQASMKQLAEDAYTIAARTPLIESLRHQHNQARHQARTASRLSELIQLLEENPKIARILDLLELVKL